MYISQENNKNNKLYTCFQNLNNLKELQIYFDPKCGNLDEGLRELGKAFRNMSELRKLMICI